MQTSSPSFSRLELLLGRKNLERLASSSVLICGLGGVGSWAAEACARNGIGHIGLIDFDTVKPSNINRQLPATEETIGRSKLSVMSERLHSIHSAAEIIEMDIHLTPDNISSVVNSRAWTCIIDAIDERQSKTALLRYAVENQIPIISSMGAANKIDCSAITTGDLFETQGCPIARLLRKNLRKFGITHGITAVYSTELPIVSNGDEEAPENDTQPGEKRPMGSMTPITAIFGMLCAAEALKHIIDTSTLQHRGE